MKVRIGQRTYSPEDGPIMVILNEEDKAAIRAMTLAERCYMQYKGLSPGEALAWMEPDNENLDGIRYASAIWNNLRTEIPNTVSEVATFNPLARTDEALRAHWRAFVDEQDELLLEHQPSFKDVLDQQGLIIAAAIERGDDPMTLLATTTLLMEPYSALYEAVMPDYAQRTFEAMIPDGAGRGIVWFDEQWQLDQYALGFASAKGSRMIPILAIKGSTIRQVDDDLLFGWNEAVSTFLRTEGARNVTRINDTTRTWLSGFLAEASDEGWGPVKAAREARRQWPEPDGPASRARMENLTRTELLGASNKGSVMGAESVAERLGVTINKTWNASFINTRDTHAAAHGQTVGTSESFTVGGFAMQHPGDQAAPPRETNSCMCFVTFGIA